VGPIRRRGDGAQAKRLGRWLKQVTTIYAESILPFDEETAHVWGRLRVPNPENPLDKQIATALIHDLTVVTRNTEHFAPTGARLLNPFVQLNFAAIATGRRSSSLPTSSRRPARRTAPYAPHAVICRARRSEPEWPAPSILPGRRTLRGVR